MYANLPREVVIVIGKDLVCIPDDPYLHTGKHVLKRWLVGILTSRLSVMFSGGGMYCTGLRLYRTYVY